LGQSQSIGFIDVLNDGAFMVRVSLTYSLSGQDIVRETGSFPYLKSGVMYENFIQIAYYFA
jgi:hypothetical protein